MIRRRFSKHHDSISEMRLILRRYEIWEVRDEIQMDFECNIATDYIRSWNSPILRKSPTTADYSEIKGVLLSIIVCDSHSSVNISSISALLFVNVIVRKRKISLLRNVMRYIRSNSGITRHTFKQTRTNSWLYPSNLPSPSLMTILTYEYTENMTHFVPSIALLRTSNDP